MPSTLDSFNDELRFRVFGFSGPEQLAILFRRAPEDFSTPCTSARTLIVRVSEIGLTATRTRIQVLGLGLGECQIIDPSIPTSPHYYRSECRECPRIPTTDTDALAQLRRSDTAEQSLDDRALTCRHGTARKSAHLRDHIHAQDTVTTRVLQQEKGGRVNSTKRLLPPRTPLIWNRLFLERDDVCRDSR